MPARGRPRPLELTAAVLIMAAGAYLRLTRLDLMEFKFDEATALSMALDVVDGRSLPVTGLMSSVGVHNPPVLIYLLAVFGALSRDPVGVAAGVAVVSTLAVGLTYAVLRPRFGASVALGSSLLFATSPWAVILGRKIWAQDLIPIFCVLLLHTLFTVIERPGARAAAALPLLLTMTAGLHFSAIALAPAVFVVIVARRREINWTALSAGCGVALLLMAPYVMYLTDGAGHDIGAAARLTGRSVSLSSLPSPRILRYPLELTGSLGWKYLLGDSAADFSAVLGAWRPFGTAASLVTSALFISGLGWLSWSVLRPGSGRRPVLQQLVSGPEGLLLVWMGSIWVATVGMRLQYVHPHYFAITYPVSFAIAVIALERIARWFARGSSPVPARLASALIVVVALSHAAWTLCFFRFVAERGGTAGDYGVVYRDTRAVVDFARAQGLAVRSTSMPQLETLARLTDRGLEGVADGRTLDVEPTTSEASPDCPGLSRTFGALRTCLPR